MEKHRLHLLIPSALWERVKALAARNRRPSTQEVIIAIERHLEEEDAPTRKLGDQ